MIKAGMSHEEINIVNSCHCEAIVFAIENWGWKTISGDNILTQTLSSSDLDLIKKGISEAYPTYTEDPKIAQKLTFEVEVFSSEKFYHNVPWTAI